MLKKVEDSDVKMVGILSEQIQVSPFWHELIHDEDSPLLIAEPFFQVIVGCKPLKN